MKKLLLIAVLILATLAMFATDPRVYQQKVTLTDGSMPGPPINTQPIPGYVLSVFLANAEGPLSPVYNVQTGNLCIKRTGPATGYFVVAYVNQSIFADKWLPTNPPANPNPDGRWLDLTLTHTASGEFVHWTRVIPNGTAAIPTDPVAVIAPPFPVSDPVITLPDIPEGTTLIGNGTNGLDVGVTVVADATIPPELLGGDFGIPQQLYTISAVGTHQLIVPRPAAYAGVVWYCWIRVGGVLTLHPLSPANVDSYDFGIIDFGAKGDVNVFINDEPTLPVEFSSFAAVLTAQNFVKLTWVTETETGVSGYNVYRSTDANQATAVQINSALIDATNTSQTATYTHVDNEVSAQTTYSYWLEIVEMDGTTAFHGPTTVYVENAPVNDAPVLVTTMGNAYPNPFKANSSTSIPVEVKDGETGTITIYNIIGQVVKTVSVKGKTDISWNGRDSKNNACGSGIYFYKLSTPSRNVTKKMVIVN